MPSSPKTPEDRAADIKINAARARKRYRTKVTKRRNFIEGEEELVKDMIVVLKLANYSHTQIAMIVGVGKTQVKEFLQDPKLQKKLLHLREALPQAAFDLGRAYLIEAVQAVVHVLRTEKDSAIILKAASELFDRFGIPKVAKSETKVDYPHETGMLSNKAEDWLAKFKDEPPELQEQAAQLVEALEEGLVGLLKKEGADAPTADN